MLKSRWDSTESARDAGVGKLIVGHYSSRITDFEAFLKEAEIERNPLTSRHILIDTENSTNGAFQGYDALRGCYTITLDGDGFNGPYYRYPNKHYNVKFTIKGDTLDRDIYLMTNTPKSGCLECAVLLDDRNMMLPIPIEVGKNFSEGSGERNLWNIDDAMYGETIIPMVIKAKSSDTYNMINLYQNWSERVRQCFMC